MATEVTRHLSNNVIDVHGTLVVHLTGEYVTAMPRRSDERLTIGVHMTSEEASELLAGLQEALA